MQAFLGELGGRLQTNMTWVMFVVIFLSQVNLFSFVSTSLALPYPKTKEKEKAPEVKKL